MYHIDEPYIKRTTEGSWHNATYPPTLPLNKGYGGYETAVRECVFHDFAVLHYDLWVVYKGENYYFMVDNDCVWLSDEHFEKKLRRFHNCNEVLELFTIDGQRLVDIIDNLDYCEAM